VTGGYAYRGSASSVLNGRYLYGDYCSGRIWFVSTTNPAVGGLLLDTSLNISSFGEDANGELYVIDHGGGVYRIDAGTGVVTRRSGADRYATAAAISAAYFSPGVPVAFVATGEGFADALAGGPAAAEEGGPLLLVRSTSIPAATAAELTRLQPASIVVLGGSGAISDVVFAALDAYTTGPLSRRAGADRYATAAAISAATFDPGVPVAFIATGQSYPDALAGGPAAAKEGGPLLLVQSNAIPPATVAELQRLQPGAIVVLGGTAVVSAAVATALDAYTTGSVSRRSGPDRYATAAAISAGSFGPGVATVFVATGEGFADALAGGPAAAKVGAPLLLVRGFIPLATANELQRLGPTSIVVLGGTGVVSANVATGLGGYTED
jgi:putative cell wall-binding protein